MKPIILSFLILISIVSNTTLANSSISLHQPTDSALEVSIKNKQNIISVAMELLRSNKQALPLLPEDYEITLWSNNDEVVVHFRQLIRFYPHKGGLIPLKATSLYNNYSVNLSTKTIITSEANKAKLNLRILAKKNQESVNFVKTHLGIPFEDSQNMSYEIYEEEDFYNIFIFLHDSFTNYTLDKTTGQVSWVQEQFCEIPEHDLNELTGVDTKSFKQIFK